MSDFVRKFIGVLLILATVGVVSCQALATPEPAALATPSVLSGPRG